MPVIAPAPIPAPLPRTDGLPTGCGDLDGATLVAAHLPTVNRAIAIVGGKRRLARAAREELSSDVYVRLLQRNGAILRAYRGEGSLLAYLVVVVQRVLLDGDVARDGKWRPSAAARRLGEVAVVLERLVFSQGLSLQESAPIVRARTGATHSDDELDFLLSLLRPRVRRRIFGVETVDDLRADTPSPEDRLVAAAAYPGPEHLARAMTRLAADDREMVRLRFAGGLRLREIARRRQIDERTIYRRFDRVLGQLRSELGATGTTSCMPPRRPAPAPRRP
jgi:RNA polymerase sigma factor (sigma-70 family)